MKSSDQLLNMNNKRTYLHPELNVIEIDSEISLIFCTIGPNNDPSESGQEPDPDKKEEDSFKTQFD